MLICLLSNCKVCPTTSPTTSCIPEWFQREAATMSAQPELPELSVIAINQQRNKYVFNIEIKKIFHGHKKWHFVTVPHEHQLSCCSQGYPEDLVCIFPSPRWIYKPCSQPPCRKLCSKIPGTVFPWCHIWVTFLDYNWKQTQIYCTFHKHSSHCFSALIFFFQHQQSAAPQIHQQFYLSVALLYPPAWHLLRGDFYPSVCRRSHTSCK